MAAEPTFRRVLLKLSGEALMGAQAYGIDRIMLDRIAEEIKPAAAAGVQIAVVVGVRRPRHGSGDGRLYRNARDGDECRGFARRAV
jgi:uridylate kinase